MRTPVGARVAVLVAAGVLALAGCGGSSGGSNTTGPSPSQTSSPVSAAQASAQAKAAFEQFFAHGTSLDQRVKLLQNGEQFRSTLKAQQTNALAQSASVKVKDVTVQGDTATVTYDILLNGQPALSGQKGTLVQKDGQWQVSVQTFCNLLQQEGGAPASCPAPSAGTSTSPTPKS